MRSRLPTPIMRRPMRQFWIHGKGQLVSGPAHLSRSGPLYPPPCVYIPRRQVIIDTDTEQGPVGFLSIKLFCVPHFFDYRKYSFYSASMTFPEFQWGKFKQLLIRGGRGDPTNQEDQGEIIKRNSSAASGQGTCSPSIHTSISLSCFADAETPPGGRS